MPEEDSDSDVIDVIETPDEVPGGVNISVPELVVCL